MESGYHYFYGKIFGQKDEVPKLEDSVQVDINSNNNEVEVKDDNTKNVGIETKTNVNLSNSIQKEKSD